MSTPVKDARGKWTYAMKLDELLALRTEGRFHHATYRGVGSLWEGLFIYPVQADGFRGFGGPIGCFPKDDPDLDEAHKMCPGSSVGAYGEG